MAVAYKGGACQNCGYNRATTSLCFHHVDPSTKSFSLSKGGLEKDWEAIKSELDKCQLLCQNCHREHHSLERDGEIDLALKRLSNVRFKKKPYKLWTDDQKELSALLSTRRKQGRKNKLVQKLGGACYVCNYSKCNAALDFHHKDPNEKDFAISRYIGKTEEEINLELTKCVLLCANCHFEEHHSNFHQKRLEVESKLLDYREKLREKKENLRTKIRCSLCGLEKIILKSRLSKNNFCSEDCSRKFKYDGSSRADNKGIRQAISKPTKAELKQLLWQIPTVKIGAIYGVSDKAVEKWAKKFGLSKPERGYWAKKAAMEKSGV